MDAVEKLPTVAELKKTWKVKKVGSAYTLTSWLGDSLARVTCVRQRVSLKERMCATADFLRVVCGT